MFDFSPEALRTFELGNNTHPTMKKLLFLFVLSLSIWANAQSSSQTINGHASRYLFSPSGFGLEKDSSYVNIIQLFYGEFQYGVNEHIAVGFGSLAFVGVYGIVTAHAQLADKLNFKTGLLAGTTVFQGFYALPFAVMTFGTPNNQFSLGFGRPFANFGGEFFSGRSFNACGYHQLGKKTGFVYETWYLPGSEIFIISPNLRVYSKANKSYYNLGLATISNYGDFFTLPTFSYAVYL